MVGRPPQWVAGHPQKALLPPPEGPAGPLAWPSGGGMATLRAIGGGQDHPLMGIGGGLATPILIEARGPQRDSRATPNACKGWSATHLIF
jgi:hypothetical protein